MLQSLSDEISSLVECVLPSVVSVYSVDIEYNVFLEPVPKSVGIASGFAVRSDGVIVTAYHAIKGMDIINVLLYKGKKVRAKVLGGDPYADVAVLKVDEEVPPLTFASSKEISPGQLVLAIGNPLGIGTTVSIGVISAVERTVRTQVGILHNMIQTDASINPGNSGGPLINMSGKVVGMCTAIVPTAQGIGFAVPAYIIKRVVLDILRYGEVRRPYLGLSIVSLTRQLVSYYDLGVRSGVLVVGVDPGSPAMHAGIRPGDVIVAVDDFPIRSGKELIEILMMRNPGDIIELTVVRGPNIHKVKVKLGVRK